MESDYPKLIWKSYVWHGDNCYFVSTIERTFDTCGTTTGEETMVWEFDYHNQNMGELLHQSMGINDHRDVCMFLIKEGKIPQ